VQQEADSLTNEYNFQIGDLLMATTYLSRTPSAGNRKKWTFSAWFKKSTSSASDMGIFTAGTSGNDEGTIKLYNYIDWIEYDSGTASVIGRLTTTQVLRDTSAWYHLVCVWDSANATAGDRMKMYLNGEEVTSFSTDTNPTLNYDSQINNGVLHNIGRQSWNSSGYFDGSMTHVHFCDGQAYQASDFGEYDANGVWKIKTSPSVTYGTNGFFILKDGNSVTDQSGNGNNFTVGGGTLTKTEDSPSNVFATLNPLTGNTFLTYQNGNTTCYSDGAGENRTAISTVGALSGKYYAEVKIVSIQDASQVGVVSAEGYAANGGNYADNILAIEDGLQYSNIGEVKNYNNNLLASGMGTFTTNDIIGIAMDLDNNKIYFHKNGTYINSGVPTSGATGTGAFSLVADKTYLFASAANYANGKFSWNFGNGYFGTTAVASAGTNASGNGIFEYDCPNGYTALSTKGLNL
jgi:hypothetical protein